MEHGKLLGQVFGQTQVERLDLSSADLDDSHLPVVRNEQPQQPL
ncbi:hypothetical protein [Sinomicrobium sp. M5D2P9]